MIPWSYEGEELKELPEGTESFVYLLQFESGHCYIGKKNTKSTRRKKVSGKSRRTVTISESNWRTYLSSSIEVKQRIKNGEQLVRREILVLCDTVGAASYHEARLQFEHAVLCSDMYLNKWINVKVYRCY